MTTEILKPLVVIESPLAGDFEKNKRYALWCAYHCFTLGEAAYASHLLFPQFLNDSARAHREFGITAGYAWAEKADLFVFYTDLGWSPGMLRAKDRWSDRRSVERQLPFEMFGAFFQDVNPDATPGFRLKGGRSY